MPSRYYARGQATALVTPYRSVTFASGSRILLTHAARTRAHPSQDHVWLVLPYACVQLVSDLAPVLAAATDVHTRARSCSPIARPCGSRSSRTMSVFRGKHHWCIKCQSRVQLVWCPSDEVTQALVVATERVPRTGATCVGLAHGLVIGRRSTGANSIDTQAPVSCHAPSGAHTTRKTPRSVFALLHFFQCCTSVRAAASA